MEFRLKRTTKEKKRKNPKVSDQSRGLFVKYVEIFFMVCGEQVVCKNKKKEKSTIMLISWGTKHY